MARPRRRRTRPPTATTRIQTNGASEGRMQSTYEYVPMIPNSTKPHPKLSAAAVFALAALLVSVTLPAAPQGQSQDGPTITPNYKDADLSQIIQAVSEVTGKNFIIDPRVNAKVTMLSATPITPAAFYEAFLAVLQVHGYVAGPAGKVIKIIPNPDARQLPSTARPADR